MTLVAAIGERERVSGFAFAGVRVEAVEHADAALGAWRGLPADVGLVILTPAAHRALATELSAQDRRLWVVLPA